MNKTDLIEALATKENLTDRDATSIIKLIFDGFIETLKNGGRIEIRGDGSFIVKEYETNMGRNPKTGTRGKVGPKKLPYFKMGKELKERGGSSYQVNPLDYFIKKGKGLS